MTPHDAMERLKRCRAKLHIAVVDLKDIRASCPWLSFEDFLRFRNLIGAARQAEKIASIQLAEWGGEDDGQGDCDEVD